MARSFLWTPGVFGALLFFQVLRAAGPSASDGTIVQVDALNPYLKYPVVQLLQHSGVEAPGPEVGVMVISLDPTRRGKQIFVSDFSNSAIYGFDGLDGNALVSFAPAPLTGPYAGMQMVTAVETEPLPDINPLAAPVIRPQLLLDEHGTGGVDQVYATMRLLDGAAQTLWTQTPSNSQYGGMPTPAASFGVIAADGSQDAVLLIDEELFASFGRSGRTGAIDWTSPNNYSQQITTPAVMDVNDPANAAFVFCRGRLACLLEKHRISDGTLTWQEDLGSGLIFSYVTVGDPAGLGHDQAVLLQRQSDNPFNALLTVVDGVDGSVLWQYDLGEGTNQWGAVAVLADLDNDGFPEMVVQTNTQLHVIKFGVGEMPGWPVQTSTSYFSTPVRSEPVIGDLAGDGTKEIAVVSMDFDTGYAYGYLDIFDQTGARRFFSGSVYMPMGAGVTPAIADVDGDGHNELLLGSSIEIWEIPEPALWVLDFSLGHPEVIHGAILWGQHGADAQHSGRALDMHPHVAVRPARVAGIAQSGQSVSVPFAIGNTGGIDLSWTLSTGVADVASCSDPASWAAFSREVGVLPGAHDSVLQVTLDATQLAPGTYDATICLDSNDGANGALRLPLHLDVVNASYTVTATAIGDGTITPNGAQQVASGGIARFEIGPPQPNTMTDISGCSGTLNGNEFTTAPITADCTVVVNYMAPEPPTLTKSFAPEWVMVDDLSTLTITLANPAVLTSTLTAPLIDAIPLPVVLANPPNASTTCPGGLVNASAGSSSVTLGTGAQIPPQSTCTVTVSVLAGVASSSTNVLATGALQTDTGDNAFAAKASLIVIGAAIPPTLSKQFSPTTITVGGTSLLAITLGNPHANAATLTTDLVDPLPIPMVVADPPRIDTDCVGGAVTAIAGSGVITLGAGAQIPGGTCTVSVAVTSASAGTYFNTIAAGALQTDFGNSPDPARAGLTVAPAVPVDQIFVDGFDDVAP